MGDNKNGKGLTVGNVILTRVDQLSRQVASLEARVAAGDGNAVIRKLTEENAKLKREISYVSAQIEGLYTTLAKMIQSIPDKVASRAPAQTADGASFDVDELASRVAAKIIIPDGSPAGYASARPSATSICRLRIWITTGWASP